MVFINRKEADKSNKKSIYRNISIYDKEPEHVLEHDLALQIYNFITDSNHSIDWFGFELWCERYEIQNVDDFMDYMVIIKETVTNFDKIYYNKTNTPEVLQALKFIESLNGTKI